MRRVSPFLIHFLIITFAVSTFLPLASTAQTPARPRDDSYDIAELKPPASEMRGAIERYTTDRASLTRSYPVSISPVRLAKFKDFYTEWLKSLQRMPFDSLSQDDRVDYLLFKNHLDHERRQLEIQAKQLSEIEPLLPFAKSVTDLEEARRRMEPIDAAKTAALLTALKKQIDDKRKAVEAGLRSDNQRGNTEAKSDERIEPIKAKKTAANRAVAVITNLKASLRNWYTLYDGYDPVFTWWVGEPYKAMDQSLTSYSAFLSEKVVGIKPADSAGSAAAARGTPLQGGGQGGQRPTGVTPRAGDTSDIVGDPIGRDALMSELESEMIPYTPEELIAIGEKDMAWCEAEMKKAARELGYGDDWHKALEHVKTDYMEPGKQPELIRELALEAIKFVDDRDLVTVPQLARDTWRMEMMTPERQLVSPFFLGGEVILVSFPTNGMAHEQKMMSMRGNNKHFA